MLTGKPVKIISYNQQAIFSWRDTDKLMFTLKASGSGQPAELSPPGYSIYEGATHISFLSQRYNDVGYQFCGGGLELADDRIADKLIFLGVGGKPMIAVWNGGFSFSISHPEKFV